MESNSKHIFFHLGVKYETKIITLESKKQTINLHEIKYETKYFLSKYKTIFISPLIKCEANFFSWNQIYN